MTTQDDATFADSLRAQLTAYVAEYEAALVSIRTLPPKIKALQQFVAAIDEVPVDSAIQRDSQGKRHTLPRKPEYAGMTLHQALTVLLGERGEASGRVLSEAILVNGLDPVTYSYFTVAVTTTLTKGVKRGLYERAAPGRYRLARSGRHE